MRYKNRDFFSMVLLALGLMSLIVITQVFTNKSTLALNEGNVEAVETFKINNGIQDLVNLSFDLQTKLSKPVAPDDSRRMQLTDSLTTLGYNTHALINLINDIGINAYSGKLDSVINTFLNVSFKIIDKGKGNTVQLQQALRDSLVKEKYGAQVYNVCLQVQNALEKNLQQTLVTNSVLANKLSAYNRILAVVAIIAIVIMATIIIVRQSQQLKLIEDLKEAELAALKGQQAKDDFLANMSHELRTPLNSLIGFGNLLAQSPLSKKQQEYVSIISSSGHNLLNIVNDVLDLSKMEAGKLKIKHQPFSLGDLLGNIEQLFSEAVYEKQLTYSTDIARGTPDMVIGDPGRLKQVLTNLVNNAIKFTNSGGVTVSVAPGTAGSEYKILFAVSDTGMGIPPDKLPLIFERFEQLEHVTTRQHGGTGLGLTIAKNLVENMGGNISVESVLGQGSVFTFTCRLEPEPGAGMRQTHVTAARDLKLGSGLKILVVEDNKANQLLLKHIMGKYDVNLSIAENGKEAIRYIENNRYDVVLMDVQMPVMDGYSAIHIIRNEMDLAALPVIAMTAYVSETEVTKCYEAGFNGHIPKPIQEGVVIEKILQFIPLNTALQEVQAGGDITAYLKGILGNDMGSINEILSEVLVQWNTDKATLEQAARENNKNAAMVVLHRLRSTFSPLGPGNHVYNILATANTVINQYEDKIDSIKVQEMIAAIEEEVGVLSIRS